MRSADEKQDFPPSRVDELRGWLELGAQRESLKVARQLLKDNPTCEEFTESVGAILILANRLRPWKRLVESAFERLIARSQRRAALVMRAHNTAEPFIRFLLSPTTTDYRPADFDLESRLMMCQGFESYVRAYVKKP